ncbi:helix-turn-helix domain-containing protein [Pedobacter hiemivivus]|uniref:XRE family transcriptional regulator n=1 Tax=Pedobacter hiemivivus TaxID=2530454 RepID=A0A4R0N6D6_9SPHI|nr:helix-turn-helix transcriptional regulator [Pedobacter hiemivivus]TCC95007.1 XRE family transcriptional regulator [Pedobacter hiemivivus]
MAGIKKKAEIPLDIKKIGLRLRQLRKEKGFSNSDEFAYEYQLNRSQYGKYEAGSEDLRLSSLVKILEKLEIGLSDFFNEDYDNIKLL